MRSGFTPSSLVLAAAGTGAADASAGGAACSCVPAHMTANSSSCSSPSPSTSKMAMMDSTSSIVIGWPPPGRVRISFSSAVDNEPSPSASKTLNTFRASSMAVCERLAAPMGGGIRNEMPSLLVMVTQHSTLVALTSTRARINSPRGMASCTTTLASSGMSATFLESRSYPALATTTFVVTIVHGKFMLAGEVISSGRASSRAPSSQCGSQSVVVDHVAPSGQACTAATARRRPISYCHATKRARQKQVWRDRISLSIERLARNPITPELSCPRTSAARSAS